MHRLHTPVSTLRFVVDFAQTDLRTASAHEIDAIYRELDSRLKLGLTYSAKESPLEVALKQSLRRVKAPGSRGASLSKIERRRRQLRLMQRDALTLLRDAASNIVVTASLFSMSIYGSPDGRGGLQVAVLMGGGSVDVLRYSLILLLEKTGTDKLQSCPAPVANDRRGATCGRLFVKVTRKTHCSTKCQMRSFMRERRAAEREGDPRKLARRSRKGSTHDKTTRTR